MSSKRDPTIWLGDILDSIQEIEDATHQVEAESFVINHSFRLDFVIIFKEMTNPIMLENLLDIHGLSTLGRN